MQLYTINIQDIQFERDRILWVQTGTEESMDAYISAERYERAMKCKFEADRKRSLCAGYLLSHALKENYPAVTTPALTAYAEPNGKPYLPEHPEIHFNLSHSGDYVVCVLDDKMVGIDIEECKTFREGIAKRFFTTEEYEDICSVQGEQERLRHFYTYWVLKESFMKAVGLGMSLEMSAFRVHLGEQITYEHHVNEKQYEARLYDVADGYCMAVCRECE